MTALPGGRRVLCLFIVCAGLMTACGKKGPPLAPLARVPATPEAVQAARVGDEVYISFTVPSANVSGQTPADVSELDVYAFTGTEAPAGEDLTDIAVRIGSYPVQPVLPPPPEPPEGEPPPPVPPPPPGFVRGATAVVREALTAEVRTPTGKAGAARGKGLDEDVAGAPAVSPVALSIAEVLRRHYFVVAVSPRGRESTPSAIVSVPLDPVSGMPGAPTATYTESSMTLTWTPPADARRTAEPAADPSLLPSRPLVPPPAPTAFHVFEVPAAPPSAPDPFALALPAPVTPKPQTSLTLDLPGPLRFGEERCFVVRPVDLVAGATVLGAASPPGCITPTDTFPPAAPQQLVAISGVGVVNLIWEPNAEPDLAGYIVLRGAAPGDTLQALTPSPIRETQYRDQTATPDVRYVYAVVAVDTAMPENVSPQSNRVEDAARQ